MSEDLARPEASAGRAGDAIVTLVVPVLNEAGSIASLLGDIERQTRPADQVIVVDGGSDDGTREILRRHEETCRNLELIEAGEATPGRGRNIGIAAARGEWIALTDAGIRLAPRWLESLLSAAAANPDADLVFGTYRPRQETFWQRIGALIYVHPLVERTPGRRMRGPFIASSLVRRSMWKAAGGFPDLRAAEDLVFLDRVRQQGARIAWAPDAEVEWDGPRSLTGIFRRFLVFSRHNARAGRWREWHAGVLRFYGAVLLLGLAVAQLGGNPLTAPPMLLLARALKCAAGRICEAGPGVLAPHRVLGIATAQVVIDAATLLGAVQFLVLDHPSSRTRQAGVEPRAIHE